MMNTETVELVAPEQTENAPEEVAQQPEVAAPETDTPEQAPDEQPDESGKAIKRMERRIQKLTADKYQTRAEAQQAKAEADALRQKLAQYETPEERSGPDPLVLAKEIARIEKIAERSNGIAKDGATRFPDFDRAVQTVGRDIGPLFDQVGRTTGLGEAILAADDPAAVLHAIGTDPELAGELGEMSTIQQVRRIARLEAEIAAPKPAQKSSAPKPITPVKAGGGGPKDPSSMTDAEFAAWRREQIKARH